MSLLGLPTELLENIIIANITEDKTFESILLACKTTYAIGKSHIRRYNRIKRWRKTVVDLNPDGWSYRSATYPDGDFRDGNCRTTWDVVNAIALDPEVAQVIESLDLREALDGNDEEWEYLLDLDDEELDEIERAVPVLFESSSLKQFGDEMDPRSQEFPRNGTNGFGHRLTFLLALLPNLKELALPKYWAQLLESTPIHILNSITTRLRDDPGRKDLPLSKLERLLPFEEIQYDCRSGLNTIDVFLGLPSLKGLHVTNLLAIDDGYTGIPFQWPVPEFSSNLREVILDGCIFDHSGIAELLEHTPQIESLRYSHDVKWHGCGHFWDCGAFVASIAEKRGETLKNLSVTLRSGGTDVTQAPTALKGFTALETLELEACFFRTTPYGGAPLDADAMAGGGAKWADIQPLADILPGSLREFTLETVNGAVNRDHNIEPLRKLFVNPTALRDRSRFPHLERLVVRPGRPGFKEASEKSSEGQQSLIDMFDAAGVELIPNGSERPSRGAVVSRNAAACAELERVS